MNALAWADKTVYNGEKKYVGKSEQIKINFKGKDRPRV
jgi:hypothetical protein